MEQREFNFHKEGRIIGKIDSVAFDLRELTRFCKKTLSGDILSKVEEITDTLEKESDRLSNCNELKKLKKFLAGDALLKYWKVEKDGELVLYIYPYQYIPENVSLFGVQYIYGEYNAMLKDSSISVSMDNILTRVGKYTFTEITEEDFIEVVRSGVLSPLNNRLQKLDKN